MTWSTAELTFEAPGLRNYFISEDWKKVVKLVETGSRCSVSCDMVIVTASLFTQLFRPKSAKKPYDFEVNAPHVHCPLYTVELLHSF